MRLLHALALALALGLVLAACAGTAPAPEPAPDEPAQPESVDPASLDLNAILRETQILRADGGRTRLVWWIPVEYWETLFALPASSVSEAQAEVMLEVLRPFSLFGVLDAEAGPGGALSFAPESQVRAALSLSTPTGLQEPLSDEEIPAPVLNLLAGMRPAIARSAGSMGENMHLFVFDNRSEAGGPIASPRREGLLELSLGVERFRWTLPLGSFLPPRTCPVDQETMSGAWKFCPRHGVRLE